MKGHKILFEDKKTNDEKAEKIVFSGVPFIIVGSKHLDCTHGIDHAISRKKKQQEEKLNVKVISILCEFRTGLFVVVK